MPMPARLPLHRAHFSNRRNAAFMADLKAAVGEWFELTGGPGKATGGMMVKTVLMLSGVVVPYGLLLWWQPGGRAAAGLLLLMGVAIAGVGFNVAHDALHGAYASRPWVNRALGLSFDLLGANSYMWRITHNVIHHTYTNIHGVDEDLSVSPLLRLAPEAPRYPFHRYQQFYAPLAYSLSTLFWVFGKDFKYFLKQDLGPYQGRQHSPGAIAWLAMSKVAYLGYALALPLALIEAPWWKIGLGFLAVHLTAGLILGVVFQLAHVVEGVEYPLPGPDGAMEHNWAVHEMRTTSDFARGNRALSWYVGGLNYQVEHHLFPQVCSVHYPALSEIVQQVARRHGVPYHEHPTLGAAVRSHFRMLQRLGRGDTPGPARAMLDGDRCPLCGGENACAIAKGKGSPASCWCFAEPVPVDLVIQFQDLPPDERICVCQRCARSVRERASPG